MKVLLSITFGLFIIPNALSGDIINVYKEIVELLPKEKLKEVYNKYMEENKQFREFDEFSFKEGPWIATQMLQNKEFLDILKYIEANSEFTFPKPDVLLEAVRHHMIEKPREFGNLEITGRSVNDFYEQAFELLPKDELSKLMKEKMKTNSEFKRFMDSIKAPEFDDLVNKFKNSKDLTKIWTVFKSKGLDLDDLHKLMYKFINLAY